MLSERSELTKVYEVLTNLTEITDRGLQKLSDISETDALAHVCFLNYLFISNWSFNKLGYPIGLRGPNNLTPT
jgi:hypothetical protein